MQKNINKNKSGFEEKGFLVHFERLLLFLPVRTGILEQFKFDNRKFYVESLRKEFKSATSKKFTVLPSIEET